MDVVDNGRAAPLRGDGWLDPAHDTERGGLERLPCARGDRGGVRVRQRMLELGHERHRALVDADHGRWKPPAHDFAGGVERTPLEEKTEAWGDEGESLETAREGQPLQAT